MPCQADLISIGLFTRGTLLIFGNCICITISVCFNIGAYQDCKALRDNGNNTGAIYLNGTCLTEESDWEAVRDNIKFYYNCTKEEYKEK